MSSKTYDTLKFIALLITPIITFLSTLINIWNVPYGDQIVATLAALDVLVGAIVVIAKANYEKIKNVGLGAFGDGDGGDVDE